MYPSSLAARWREDHYWRDEEQWTDSHWREVSLVDISSSRHSRPEKNKHLFSLMFVKEYLCWDFFKHDLFFSQKSCWCSLCFKRWGPWIKKGTVFIYISALWYLCLQLSLLHVTFARESRRINGWNSVWKRNRSPGRSWSVWSGSWLSRRTTVSGKKQATKQHCGHSPLSFAIYVFLCLCLFFYYVFFTDLHTDQHFLEIRQVWDFLQLL